MNMRILGTVLGVGAFLLIAEYIREELTVKPIRVDPSLQYASTATGDNSVYANMQSGMYRTTQPQIIGTPDSSYAWNVFQSVNRNGYSQ